MCVCVGGGGGSHYGGPVALINLLSDSTKIFRAEYSNGLAVCYEFASDLGGHWTGLKRMVHVWRKCGAVFQQPILGPTEDNRAVHFGHNVRKTSFLSIIKNVHGI